MEGLVFGILRYMSTASSILCYFGEHSLSKPSQAECGLSFSLVTVVARRTRIDLVFRFLL